jgi:hypothetical protein
MAKLLLWRELIRRGIISRQIKPKDWVRRNGNPRRVPARTYHDRVFDVLSWLKRERAALIGGTGMFAFAGWAIGMMGIG